MHFDQREICRRLHLGKNKSITLSGGKRNQHGAPPKNFIVVEDMIPAIIKRSDFAKVMEKMEINKQRRAAYKAKQYDLLSGIVFYAAMRRGHAKQNDKQ